MRRSLRLQSRTTVCPAHYHQADSDDSMALCGLLSFNNLYHLPILGYEDCQAVARKWVGAENDLDKRLTIVADNQGRGAFSIQILKIALEKQGYTVFNITKQTKVVGQLEDLACKSQPCVLLCGNSGNTIAHAVTICSYGHLHDPDCDNSHKLSAKDQLNDLQVWLAANELSILNIYKAVKQESVQTRLHICDNQDNYKHLKARYTRRTKRGKKKCSNRKNKVRFTAKTDTAHNLLQ